MFPVSPGSLMRPLFRSEGDRDESYAEWVANGGEMVRGMSCCVADLPRIVLQTFDGERWISNGDD